MLDPRIYRAAWLPALFALIVCSFSLKSPPRAASTNLAPDSFAGLRAFSGPGTGLQDLATSFPHRRPGDRGDRGVAARMATAFRQSGLAVSLTRFRGATALGDRRLENVVGVRAGLQSGRIVVIAHRDALAAPATADLSGTAVLAELAHVFQGRVLHKTLVLVSTSGGSGGGAGAANFARRPGGPVEAVLVLGDLAGRHVRGPLLVPWSNRLGVAPPGVRRTTADAVALETGRRVREPRLVAQFARLAFPLTTGEQGEVLAHGLPAVLVSASGEFGPGGERSVSQATLQRFGRGVLRTISALDGQRSQSPAPRPELLVRGKLVPEWAVRLLVAALMLPVLLGTIDGFARVRRRRHPVRMWLAWTVSGALPFALAIACALLFELVGLLPAVPSAPVRGGAIPLDAGGVVALAALALVAVLGWLTLRPLAVRRAGVSEAPASPGAAAGVGVVGSALVTAIWAFNPFAAALLVPALHVAVLVTGSGAQIRRGPAFLLLAAALVPIALVVAYYAHELHLGLLEIPWTALLLVVGGHVGPLAALAWCVLLGWLLSVVAIIHAQRPAAPPVEQAKIRGPVTYAGPGSLGGTKSALRR